jgi:hypothetical protein
MKACLLCKSFSLLLLVLAAFWLAIETASAEIENSACLECHGAEDAEPFVDGALFSRSVHADNQRTSCHSDIKEAEHDTPLKKVSCAECHDLESEKKMSEKAG